MRFMELIRKKGGTCLGVFLVVFLVSVFAGLGISGGFSFRGCSAEQPVNEIRFTSPRLVTEGDLSKAVMTVNGRPVSEQSFFDKLTILTRGRSYTDRPELQLQAYGYATGYAISEEIIAAKGEELEVKVTAEDLQEAKDEIINAQLTGGNDSSSGNLLGDIAKGIDSTRQKKKAFTDYLASRQMTEDMWEEQARRELFQSKTQEEWQDILDAEAKVEAEGTKALIDQRLEEGASFEEVALEFSQDPNAEGAETIEPFWLSRGLVLKEQEDAAFDAEDGTVTDWIEVPAGWHRFEVLEHKRAEGEEFEAERENIITALKASSDDESFEPTEQQIARKFEQVRVRQLMLKTSTPGAVNEKISELVERADVEINNPYILAYQALYNDKLQPPHAFGMDKLQQIAELAPVGEGYDFGLIQEYLDATAEAMAGAPEEPTEETGDGAAETGDDAEATEVETAAAPTDEEPEDLPTCYALAVGLLITGLQDVSDRDRATYFHYYIVGRVLTDWLGDEDAHDRQPIDRAVARELIEENMARAAESYEYSAAIHATRGLNLAWLGNEEEALVSLELAERYASNDATDPVFEDIRKGYEILDATDKLEALDELLAGYRQEQLQQMIQQAQQQQAAEGGIGNGNIVTIPEGGDVEGAIEDAQEEGGGWVKLTEGDSEGESGEATEGDGEATETPSEDTGEGEPTGEETGE